MLRNIGSTAHWLEVRLVGTASNRDAFGARVRVELAKGPAMIRGLHSGSSYLSASAKALHFGLGDSAKVARLVVDWPGGGTSVVENVAADQSITIRQDR